jgi:hypothetical protein
MESIFGIEKLLYSYRKRFLYNIQFKEMNKTFNPKYTVNEFKYSYKIPIIKETQVKFSRYHTWRSIHTLFNKNVENIKQNGMD